MKKVFSGKWLILSATVLMSVFAFTSCNRNDSDTPGPTMYNISGNASGSQMVPAVAGNGTATITGTYNPNTRVLTYTTNWNGLSGAPTSGGFYSGASGTSGTLIGSQWSLGTGLTETGTLTGQTTLTADQAAQLTSGNWYYTLGTANNSTGEVRGQITATATP